jgi:hypothetical protein
VRAIITALFLAFSHCANADEAPKLATMDDAHAQLSVCLSFYSILRECAKEALERTDAEAAMLRIGNLMTTAAEAAHLQPSDEQLRFDLNLLDQRSFIGDSCIAVDRLRIRYGEQCDALQAGTR